MVLGWFMVWGLGWGGSAWASPPPQDAPRLELRDSDGRFSVPARGSIPTVTDWMAVRGVSFLRALVERDRRFLPPLPGINLVGAFPPLHPPLFRLPPLQLDWTPSSANPGVDFSPLGRSGNPDPFSALLPHLRDVVGAIRDFIDGFALQNDRGFANLQNFRAEIRQQLYAGRKNRFRVDLEAEGYRNYRVTGVSFNIDAGGIGARASYDFHPRVTAGVTFMPVYAEYRNLLIESEPISRDLLARASIAGHLSVRPIDGVEIGTVLNFQPIWVEFGRYRSLQEIYARLRLQRDRVGNERYYLEELVFIPRVIRWADQTGPIGEAPALYESVSEEGRTISSLAPDITQPRAQEWIFMGALGFRFSL
jgi:hypothetical protein